MIEIRNKYFMQFCWKNHVSVYWNIMDRPLESLWWGVGGGVEVKKYIFYIHAREKILKK